MAQFWREYRENWIATLALAVVLLIVAAALAAPLITPATPVEGKALPAPLDPASKSDAQATATAGEAGEVKAAAPSRAVKPALPRSPINVPGIAESAPTPGLYLSRTDDKNDLRLRFRFAGLLPKAESKTEPKIEPKIEPKAESRAHAHSHAKLSASHPTRHSAAQAETAQSSDPCLRTQSGTLVIRTGQANGPCSGAEFRAQMTRQLKAAMDEIDAGATEAGSPVMAASRSKPSAAAHHIMLTAPPFGMTLVARAPGEDNLRRLNSRASWADQYQSRIAEIRIGR
jgi:hypothetical protein